MIGGFAATAAMAEMKKRRTKPDVTKPKVKVVDLKPITKKNGMPIFECKVCSAEFNKRFNRDRHMTLIHKAKPPLYRKRLPPVVQRRQDIFGTTSSDEEVTKKSPKRKAMDADISKDVKKMKKEDMVKPMLYRKMVPPIIQPSQDDTHSSEEEEVTKKSPKRKAVGADINKDAKKMKKEDEALTEVIPDGIKGEEEDIPAAMTIPEDHKIEEVDIPSEEEEEEEEGISPPEEEVVTDGDKPPHDDKFNLIQMPLGKEVVVTVFITTK